MEAATVTIPESLIYERIAGRPVYYAGYRDYLNGNRSMEELMGSSYLQGFLGTQLVLLLGRLLDPVRYRIIANEIGLKFGPNAWRAADLAIFSTTTLKGVPLLNKYLEVPPEIVIEIDTKADLHDLDNPLGYYQEKTDQLLEFGVRKVIWIFTDTRKVLIAPQGDNWTILPWERDVEVMPEVVINVAKLLEGSEL